MQIGSFLGSLNAQSIWLLSRQFDFEMQKLTEAIRLTFLQRKTTEILNEIVIFTETFKAEKQLQWQAFRNRLRQVTGLNYSSPVP